MSLAPAPTCLCSSTLKELVFHTDSWVLGHPLGDYIKTHKNPYLRNVAPKVKQIKQLVPWLQMHFFVVSLWLSDLNTWIFWAHSFIHKHLSAWYVPPFSWNKYINIWHWTLLWNEEYPVVRSMISGESFRINCQELVEQVGGKEGNQLEVGIYRLCLSWKSKWSQDPETFKSKQLIRKRSSSEK